MKETYERNHFKSIPPQFLEILAKAVTILLETGDWEKTPMVETNLYVKLVSYKTKLKTCTIIRYYNFALEKLLGKKYRKSQDILKEHYRQVNSAGSKNPFEI